MHVKSWTGEGLGEGVAKRGLNHFVATHRVGLEVEGNGAKRWIERGGVLENEVVIEDYCASCTRVSRTAIICSRCSCREGVCRCCEEVCDMCGVCREQRAQGRPERANYLEWLEKKLKCGERLTESGVPMFLKIYNDGSVDTEVVTGPLRPWEIEGVLKECIPVMRRIGVVLSPSARAGGHQTVSHGRNWKKPTLFNSVMAGNVVQLVRYYLPALITCGCVVGTSGRDTGSRFRGLPVNGDALRPVNEKYSAVHVKPDLAVRGRPAMIEFRYPDSSDEVEVWKVNTALILGLCHEAFKMSASGLALFSQNHWKLVETITEGIFCGRDFNKYEAEWVRDLRVEMAACLGGNLGSYVDSRSRVGLVEMINEAPFYEPVPCYGVKFIDSGEVETSDVEEINDEVETNDEVEISNVAGAPYTAYDSGSSFVTSSSSNYTVANTESTSASRRF